MECLFRAVPSCTYNLANLEIYNSDFVSVDDFKTPCLWHVVLMYIIVLFQ